MKYLISLFTVHDYLGVKRVKIRGFHQKRLRKQANSNFCSCPCGGTHEEASIATYTQGHMRKPLLCEFYSFQPFF